MATGSAAEREACAYLRRQGLRLRERNYRCRWGEIDLVMEAGPTLVFVEVRYRRRGDYGGALGSVDRAKQKRLLRAASAYLARHRLADRPVRFDVVALGSASEPEWIEGAFEAD